MSPRSPHPLAELAEGIEQAACAVIEAMKSLIAPTSSIRAWADNRLDHAMRCPECGHGGELDPVLAEEHADGCECTDPLCACNPEAVVFGEPPR